MVENGRTYSEVKDTGCTIRATQLFVVFSLLGTGFSFLPPAWASAADTALEIRYGGELNQVPMGCEIIGMGNAGVGIPYRTLSFFWNPAHSAFVNRYRIAVEGVRLYGGLSDMGTIGLSAPIQKNIGIGLLYRGFFPHQIQQYDSLEGTFFDRLYNYSIDGYPGRGIFHNNQHTVILSLAQLFAIPVPRPSHDALPLPVDLGVGISFKSLWMTMTPGDKVRMGYIINGDAGMCLRVGVDYSLVKQAPSREVCIACCIRDFLPTKMIWLHSYEKYTEPVHKTQLYGLSYVDKSGILYGNWTLAGAIERQYDTHLRAGIEGELFDRVAFRCGMSGRTLTIGTGIRYQRYTADYAFTFDEIQYSIIRLAVGVAL